MGGADGLVSSAAAAAVGGCGGCQAGALGFRCARCDLGSESCQLSLTVLLLLLMVVEGWEVG